MWDRKELKARGKQAFRANYWPAVLMAFILLFVTGGGAGSFAGANGFNINYQINENNLTEDEGIRFGEAVSGFIKDPVSSLGRLGDAVNAFIGSDAFPAFYVLFVGLFAFAGAASLLLRILLLNPVEVGCQHFFLRNSAGQGEISSLSRSFKPNWSGNVKTMFLRDLFLFLWMLLFIVPGIIKSYSYRMVPYILADYPELSGTAAITMSRKMMRGSKWRAFVLDLSFIGWHILSALTLGILGIFFVAPYQCSTNAELYQALKNQVQS